MTRPYAYETHREPNWEIVDILDRKLAGNMVVEAYDYISLTYTGSNLTSIVFKTGGSGGSTVATLTLSYTGTRLDTITKS